LLVEIPFIVGKPQRQENAFILNDREDSSRATFISLSFDWSRHA